MWGYRHSWFILMRADSKPVGIGFVHALLCLISVFASGQTQTTGRIAGVVRDTQGAVVAGAEHFGRFRADGQLQLQSTDRAVVSEVQFLGTVPTIAPFANHHAVLF